MNHDVAGGFIGLDAVYQWQFAGPEMAGALSWAQRLLLPFTESPVAAAAGLLAAGLGFIAAYALYADVARDPLPERMGAVSRFIRNRFYFDELYQNTIIRLHDSLAALAAWFDRWIIAGAGVRGAHGTTELLGRALRLLQTGNLQTYAFLFALGVALVLYLALK